mmetsp:Transcript_14216/g.40282  ORF Transcript_14216/g.40282 Transcript_14216/m.40282 type:complete len:240 (-) Transcript_14216:170-889(-)
MAAAAGAAVAAEAAGAAAAWASASYVSRCCSCSRARDRARACSISAFSRSRADCSFSDRATAFLNSSENSSWPSSASWLCLKALARSDSTSNPENCSLESRSASASISSSERPSSLRTSSEYFACCSIRASICFSSIIISTWLVRSMFRFTIIALNWTKSSTVRMEFRTKLLRLSLPRFEATVSANCSCVTPISSRKSEMRPSTTSLNSSCTCVYSSLFSSPSSNMMHFSSMKPINGLV